MSQKSATGHLAVSILRGLQIQAILTYWPLYPDEIPLKLNLPCDFSRSFTRGSLRKMALAGVLPGLSELDGRLVMALKVFTATSALLLLWRWWRFTARPTFTPNEPKELPYWIPCEFSLF